MRYVSLCLRPLRLRNLEANHFSVLFSPAVFYSFSFCPNPNWTSFFPEGNEIVQYLHWVCEKYQITDKIECNTDVDQCRWLEQEQVWEITLRHLVHGVGDLSSKDRRKRLDEQGPQAIYSSTEVIRAKVLVSAVGGLVEPKGWPEQIEGRNDFKGSIFHSARWEFDVDMKDKDVVVVGTGCSAAQFVPRLTKAPYNARSVTQIMRSPPWVVPRAPPPGGDEGWEKWTPTIFNYVPYSLQLMRALIFFGAEGDFNLFGGTEKSAKHRAKYEAMLLRHIKRTVPEKYQNLLTPDYGVGCKRRIFDATWFPGLNDPKLELTTQPLTAVHEKSVTLGPGTTYLGADKSAYNGPTEAREIPADVIILANGFDTTRWLHPLRVEGKNGKDLIDQMDERGGPQAYLGTAMDGFPNFFMLFGPNTATGHSSVILASENMVIHALKFIGPILKGDVNTVDVKKEAEMAFTKDLQRELKGMVWQKGGCSSWYYTQDGWNSTVYPYVLSTYLSLTLYPRKKNYLTNYFLLWQILTSQLCVEMHVPKV